MRTAAKVDANQREIVSILKAHGASVTSLAAVGKGVPDLLVGLDGMTYVCEVKDGAKAASKQQLTEDQQDWIAAWRGSPVVILRTADQTDRWCRVVRGSR